MTTANATPTNLGARLSAADLHLAAQIEATASHLDAVGTGILDDALAHLEASRNAAIARLAEARQFLDFAVADVLQAIASTAESIEEQLASLPSPAPAAPPQTPQEQLAAEIARVAALPPREPSPDAQTMTMGDAVEKGIFTAGEATAIQAAAAKWQAPETAPVEPAETVQAAANPPAQQPQTTCTYCGCPIPADAVEEPAPEGQPYLYCSQTCLGRASGTVAREPLPLSVEAPATVQVVTPEPKQKRGRKARKQG